MGVDLTEYYPVTQVPSKLPCKSKGKPVHRASVFRWCSVGVGGRRLRTVRIGGSLFTCDQWLMQFINGDAASPSPVSEPNLDAVLRAEHELSAAGIR